ncbi:hypothetical protein EVAR_83735_1 [Eumeta japonica]|uniref:Uncharacterized protein n=1 Tax=Eumeta variegata TaxID=151549 RepID=A0A4C1WC24_EUMVA|nr:hypothetical protein EVAR_83735_1 [Eumeta japonica]
MLPYGGAIYTLHFPITLPLRQVRCGAARTECVYFQRTHYPVAPGARAAEFAIKTSFGLQYVRFARSVAFWTSLFWRALGRSLTLCRPSGRLPSAHARENSSAVSSKPKRRTYLLKRKALTTGFFDQTRGKDEKASSRADNLPLNQRAVGVYQYDIRSRLVGSGAVCGGGRGADHLTGPGDAV